MLRSCAFRFGGSWADHLHMVEFAYNNSYHSSIGMPPSLRSIMRTSMAHTILVETEGYVLAYWTSDGARVLEKTKIILSRLQAARAKGVR